MTATTAASLSKQEELDRLDAFIASLPEDTYLRPALTSFRPYIERDMRSDFIPDLEMLWYKAVESNQDVQRAKLEVAELTKEVNDLHRQRRGALEKLHSIGAEVTVARQSFNELVSKLGDVAKAMR